MNQQLSPEYWLPYTSSGLYCQSHNSKGKRHDRVGKLVHVDFDHQTVDLDYIFAASSVPFSGLDPILRPESDLYRPITQKGYNNDQPFVPIVEIANSCGKGFWERSPRSGWIVNEDNNIFLFDDGTFCITDGYHRFMVYNQHRLFDLLHLWKIDYRGLIGAGLAIDVNTLEQNPYA